MRHIDVAPTLRYFVNLKSIGQLLRGALSQVAHFTTITNLDVKTHNEEAPNRTSKTIP